MFCMSTFQEELKLHKKRCALWNTPKGRLYCYTLAILQVGSYISTSCRIFMMQRREGGGRMRWLLPKTTNSYIKLRIMRPLTHHCTISWHANRNYFFFILQIQEYSTATITSYRGHLFNRLMMMCNCIRSPIRHVQYILALNKEKKRFYSWMKLGMKIYGYYSYLELSPSEL